MDHHSEPTCYYVYFRLRAELDESDAAAALRAMQADLARETGVRGRLLRRHGDRNTWMEVYEDVRDPARFEHALSEAAAAHGLAGMVETGSARHLERFDECA